MKHLNQDQKVVKKLVMGNPGENPGRLKGKCQGLELGKC